MVHCLTLPCGSIHSSAGVRPTVRASDWCYDIHRFMKSGWLSIKKPGKRCWWYSHSGAVKHHQISNMYGFRSFDGHVVRSICNTKNQTAEVILVWLYWGIPCDCGFNSLVLVECHKPRGKAAWKEMQVLLCPSQAQPNKCFKVSWRKLSPGQITHISIKIGRAKSCITLKFGSACALLEVINHSPYSIHSSLMLKTVMIGNCGRSLKLL